MEEVKAVGEGRGLAGRVKAVLATVGMVVREALGTVDWEAEEREALGKGGSD